MARPVTENAADPRQVRFADRLAKRRDAALMTAVRESLAHGPTRYLLAEVFTMAGLYETTFDQNPGYMAFLEGRRAFGLKVLALCARADETLLDQLESERRGRAARDQREIDAVHLQRESDDAAKE